MMPYDATDFIINILKRSQWINSSDADAEISWENKVMPWLPASPGHRQP